MSATISGDTSIRQFTSGIRRSAAARFIRVGRDRAWRAAGRVVLGSLVCAASVMCATSAQAQVQVTRTVLLDEQNFPFSDTSPCNGSVVSGQEHIYIVSIERLTATGFLDTTFRIDENGLGANFTNLSDTAEYKFRSFSEARVRSSTPNFKLTMRLRKHMISQGHSGLDYFVHQSFTVSPLSPPSRNSDKDEFRCK